MDLMKIPLSSELLNNKVRWPVFLLANKVGLYLKLNSFLDLIY